MTTREKLIEAAFGLFSRNGFHSVGLDQILSDVGVTKTTFYNHFESRDDLIVAMLHHRDAAQTDSFIAAMTERAGYRPRDQLYAICDVLEEWFADDSFRGCIFMAAATEFPNPHDPIHQQAILHGKSFRERLSQLCEAADAHDPDRLAQQLNIIVHGAISDFHLLGNANAADAARGAVSHLLDCSLPEPAGAK